MSSPRYWPSMTDYQQALQSPAISFTSPELQAAAPVETKLGLPRPICGTFASVYELVGDQRRWAVKCFLRNTPDLHGRYAKISDQLQKNRSLGYFVDFEYQQQAIRVQGELFPLVKMEWIEACQLNTFIEQNLSNLDVLAKLSRHWDKLVADLQAANIAHGDLQHGNILVTANSEIRLIDYDGMWVPSLEGESSNETGHPDFQLPTRTQNDFHANIDAFSAAVIQTAISALICDQSLWDKYNNGDNLLFRRRDFVNPGRSALIADLEALDDDVVRSKLDFVINACRPNQKPARGAVPDKSQPPAPPVEPESPQEPDTPEAEAEAAAAPAPTSWLNDHVDDFETDNQAPRQSYLGARHTQRRNSAGTVTKVIRKLFRI
jgi:hypothetical protein